MNDYGYHAKILANLQQVNDTQSESIRKAGELMADAIAEDRLIHVYGGGGHTTLCMGEMFFRAGGLCNINPCMETGLSLAMARIPTYMVRRLRAARPVRSPLSLDRLLRISTPV